MEQNYTDQQNIIRKAFEKFLEDNKELVLRRIIGLATIESGPNGIEVNAIVDKDINLNTLGLGKAKYNGVELNTGGSGGGTLIVGSGCVGSAVQPRVECSPSDAPCEVRITVGKNGKLRILESPSV